MAFPSSIRDGDGVIPIAQGYVPGTGFKAQQNSSILFTDASSNTSTGVVVAEATIESVITGQNFVACSGFQTNGATGNFPVSIFNVSTNTKSVLIYSIVVIIITVGGPVQINAVTTNPAWGTNVTPLNNSAGGAASMLPASGVNYTTTTQTLGSNTAILAANRLPSNAATEMLTNNRTILLPVGVSQGITTYVSPTGAGSWLVTYSWIEF